MQSAAFSFILQACSDKTWKFWMLYASLKNQNF